MSNEEIVLVRDTSATLIPAGDECILKAGTKATISQALGGSVTIRTDGGLYRIAGNDLEALGNYGEQYQSSVDATPSAAQDAPFSEEQVWEAMKGCYDPEIPVNVVDLGLIYDMQIVSAETAEALKKVQVKMTLTAQGCGMGPVIAEDVKKRIDALPGVAEAQVDIVWDPPWTPHMISEDGRQKLGLE
ncbi:MAG: putative Fe-S cluster assembly protein SufT [Opitutales bacterium]